MQRSEGHIPGGASNVWSVTYGQGCLGTVVTKTTVWGQTVSDGQVY